MDHQQQTEQTEKIIVEMLEFLDSSSEEDNNDFEKTTAENCNDDMEIIKEDDNFIEEKYKNCVKNKNLSKKVQKTTSTIAKELKKLKQQFPIWNTKEIDPITIVNTLNCKAESDNPVTDYANLDWHKRLEINCRRSLSNSYIQEIHKAIYQDATSHPPSGSAEYYQAAQNYVLYGKHFLDFPDNLQAVLNDKNAQNAAAAEGTNLMTNFGHYIYPKSNGTTPNSIAAPVGGLTSAAASAGAYYQICNSMQAQARPALSNSLGNSTAYGIFLGNKVTYVAATPTTPSPIYNQHSTTTINFISNSLANAALATSPTILYTNPMLTTTTQQYLNSFFKETQFLSTALTTANSTQSPTVPSNGNGVGLYERLVYAQILQQQLYQTQQAAAVAAMFQHKQRAAAAAATIAAAARQSNNGINVNVVTNSNRTSPQHLTTVPITTSSNCNGSSLSSCSRQASSSPTELLRMKPQTSTPVASVGNIVSSKTASD